MLGQLAAATDPPLTWHTAWSSWQPAYGWDVGIVAAAAAYAIGWCRLRKGQQPWSAWRGLCFFGGLVVAAVVLNSGIAVYSTALFSVHMVQHLTLIMIVPYLLIAGHPLSLWVQAGREGARERRERILRSRIVSAITNPVVTLVLYGSVLAGTHLTSFIEVMLLHPWLHQLEIGLYLLAGYLCFLPLLGFEPLRWQHFPIPLRLALVMVGMVPDTGIGVVLMTSGHVLFPAFGAAQPGMDLQADQRLGGALMWVVGDGLMSVVLLVLAGLWMTAAGSEAGLGEWLESARRNALTGTAGFDGASGSGDVDSDDQILANYNALLAELAGKQSNRPNGATHPKSPDDDTGG